MIPALVFTCPCCHRRIVSMRWEPPRCCNQRPVFVEQSYVEKPREQCKEHR